MTLREVQNEFPDQTVRLVGRIANGPQIFQIDGVKYRAFEDEGQARKYCRQFYFNYLTERQEQIIEFSEKYTTYDIWRNYVDTEALAGYMIDHFDEFTGGHWRNSAHREAMLDEIAEFPLDKLIVILDGDAKKLSKFLFPYFDLNLLIDRMIEISGVSELLGRGIEIKTGGGLFYPVIKLGD